LDISWRELNQLIYSFDIHGMKTNGTMPLTSEEKHRINVNRHAVKEMDVVPDSCDYCRKEHAQLQRCSRCRVTRYCGSECQRFDYKNHKRKCFVVRVPVVVESEEEDDGLGLEEEID